ncbi:hypothetical protein GIB67_024077 [Kingdonia uniflora]|uniref:Retrotransposon gag domain-containing protein n=1 Tax=Kingdonia uniflora TaxID=39325 RepID=A0A7J7MMN2_9MAGN|nr:hypothetical protein GIB67_024077 [Kingdonia uniflora]
MRESNLKRGSHYLNLEILLSGCSPFVNVYRLSMSVSPRSCELLDWYGVTVAYETLQQGGRASRDFYNIVIDKIVHVIEDRPLEDVVAGKPLRWFYTLPEGSIITFKQLRELFIKNYSHNRDKEDNLYSLFSLKKMPREKLETFTKKFLELARKLDRLDQKITILAFTNTLLVDVRAKEYLVLNKPTTLDDIIEKVNGYIDLKRMVSDRQKTHKLTLTARDQSICQDFNRAADQRGDRK